MGNIVASFQTTAEQALRSTGLKGKTAVVTGGSSGIGLETVRVLAKAGAKVIVAAPKPDKAQEAIETIRPDAGDNPDMIIMKMDLTSFSSIRAFASQVIAEHRRVDYLILNAAVMRTPQWITREGFEFQTGVNYFGHVELAKRLLEGLMLGQEHASRLIILTCKLPLESPQSMQWRDLNYKTREYSSAGAYAQSKIALALWGTELASRLAKTNVGVYIVHPGVAITKLNRFLPIFSVLYDAMVAPFVKTIPQAAATTVHCCVSDKAWELGHGQFFENCKPAKAPHVLENKALAQRLWEKTEETLAGAQLDSHEPIDYNYGKLVFNRFYELFLGPIVQQFRALTGSAKRD